MSWNSRSNHKFTLRFMDELHPSHVDLLHVHVCAPLLSLRWWTSAEDHHHHTGEQENWSSSSSPSLCSQASPGFSWVILRFSAAESSALRHAKFPVARQHHHYWTCKWLSDSCWLAEMVREAGPPASPAQWCHWNRRKRCWSYYMWNLCLCRSFA